MAAMRVVLLVVVVLFVVPCVMALSISNPYITLAPNTTTSVPFDCAFTPYGNGTLSANVTWWVYRSATWSPHLGDDETLSPSNGDLIQTSFQGRVESTDTVKHDIWKCQVALSNGSQQVYANSTTLTIFNSPPEITFPTLNQTVSEDVRYTRTATAYDPDGDNISVWLSADQNAGIGGVLFVINQSTGVIDFLVSTESKVGNHSMIITALDDDPDPKGGSRVVVFEVFARNDAPEFDDSVLYKSCNATRDCFQSIGATDEENDLLTFNISPGFSWINFVDGGAGVANYSFIPTFDDVGVHYINVTVSDGVNITSKILTLNISGINIAPTVTFQNNSGVLQNASSFAYYLKVWDQNFNDTINITMNTTCGFNPWNYTLLSNGVNSTNATFIINATLNNSMYDSNDFVVCRDVEITIVDYTGSISKSTQQLNVTLNITNLNDPPVIHQISYYPENNMQQNASDLSFSTGTAVAYRINATDIDSLTYDGESFNFSFENNMNVSNATTLYLGNMVLQINSVTGRISSLKTNLSDIGNYTFNVTITDDEGLSDVRLFLLSILRNDAPRIFGLNYSSCTENVPCVKYLRANDTEGENLSLVYLRMRYTTLKNVTSYSSHLGTLVNYNISFFDFDNGTLGSNTTYLMNFTVDDDGVGYYRLNFSLMDSINAYDWGLLYFNVTNVNDPPYLDKDNLTAGIQPLSFDDFVVVNNTFSAAFYGSDADLVHGTENLTFAFNYLNGSIANTVLTKTAESEFTLQITPLLSEEGNYSINLSVSDLVGIVDSQIINFTVYPLSNPPEIQLVKPTFNNSEFGTPETNNFSSYSALENTSVLFDVQAIDRDGDAMTVKWYYNDELVLSNPYLTESSFTKYFDFWSTGHKNVTLVVEDEYYAKAQYDWDVLVGNVNRKPKMINYLENLTSLEGGKGEVQGEQVWPDFFFTTNDDKIVFLDPDDDLNENGFIDGDDVLNLSFAVNSTGGCYGKASFDFSGSSMTITPLEKGTCYTNFFAVDANGERAISNVIRIDITKIGDESGSSSSSSSEMSSSGGAGQDTVQETVPVPIFEEEPEPTAFKLIIPGITSLYENGTVVIPIRLKNSWDDVISAITLSADSQVEAKFIFSKRGIASIPQGGHVDINLTIENYRIEGPFEVNVSAYVGSLDYTDVSTIYVNALERGREDIDSLKSRIGFARDLLSDNPECQELNELLDEAQKDKNITNSLVIINNVIKGCKYVVNQNKVASEEVPQSFLGRLEAYTGYVLDYEELFIWLAAVFAVTILVGIIIEMSLKKI